MRFKKGNEQRNRDWEKVKLSEVCNLISRGITPSYTDENGVTVINQRCIRDFRVDFANSRLTDPKRKIPEQKLLKSYDILINSTGVGTLGRVAQIKKVHNEMTVDSHVTIVRGNEKVCLQYLGYNLFMQQRNIEHLGEGSTGQTELSRIRLGEEIELFLPTVEEQQAIADILSAFDKKIDINNQINKKLEEMAQAMFKHWFVDFEFPNENGEPYKSSGGEMVESELGMIPKGWEIVKLNEVIDFIKNTTKPGKHLSDRKYVPIDTMSIKSVTINSYKSFEEAKSSLILFEKYDILIGAMRVYFHRVNISPTKGVTRSTTFVLRSKGKKDISYNLFLLNLPSTIDYANQSSIGSTIPYAVWEGGLGEMLIAYPPQNIREHFNKIVFPLLNNLILNSQENLNLGELRNSLLPKLMSGELRVPLNEEET